MPEAELWKIFLCNKKNGCNSPTTSLLKELLIYPNYKQTDDRGPIPSVRIKNKTKKN